MSAAVIEDVDLGKDYVEAVEKDKSIPCEYYGEFCENAAEYMFVRTCCGREIFFCEDCMYEVMKFIREDQWGTMVCLACETKIVNLSEWLKYVGRV